MNQNTTNLPFLEELPSEYSDRLGAFYTKKVTQEHKKNNGQFFTPTPIAHLMASYCTFENETIRILDPGCGFGVLTCALVEHLITQNKNLKFIEVVAYETDKELVSFSKNSFLYLKEWLLKKGINFDFLIHLKDFVLDKIKTLENVNSANDNFDVIISNPPYFKLSKNDERAIVAKEIVGGQTNIYSIFMGISSKLLKENGELIFITPRSFASGNYFKMFRELFFNTVQLEKIHLFNSRKDTFNRDSVLQETLILKAIKTNINLNKNITICSSFGIKDIYNASVKSFSFSELINLNSKEKILHLPTNDKEEQVFKLVNSWHDNLINFNIHISTGPVVFFRSLNFIRKNKNSKNVFLAPLFWLQNINKMSLEWPISLKNKGQYIKIEESSKSILIANKNYVLLRRFSTKDDKSRLIAAPYFCNFYESNFIGVENKVNYIYRKDGDLEEKEIVGLSALLNSELFDTYFQIFNGSVNVSATELREMRFPPMIDIQNIGSEMMSSSDFSMKNVNNIINEYYEIEGILK